MVKRLLVLALFPLTPRLVISTVAIPIVPEWQTVVPDTGTIVDLSHNQRWELRSQDEKYNVTAQVPSDLLTDLLKAGVIDDPYLDRNFLTQRHVWMGDHVVDDNAHANRTRTWIYTTSFELPTQQRNGDDIDIISAGSFWTWKLVVEGMKMGAHIHVNGFFLGTIANQFARYTFGISKEHLRAASSSTNNLTVTFDPEIPVDGRFTACSGGWDWAPYVKARDAQGKRHYTLGITKPIYLVAIQKYAITYAVPKIYYHGHYPQQRMSQPNGDFELRLDVHLDVVATNSLQAYPDITVQLPAQKELVLTPLSDVAKQFIGETIVTTTAIFPKEHVDLWWPNGMGDQPLYDIFVGFHSEGNEMTSSSPKIHKRIGFRTIALVTINETDSESMARAISEEDEGTGNHGMYFRVNGALFFGRGANFIPMDQLEGRLSDRAHRIAVQSAAAANMNMMRVWGGGMFLPEAFYNACDELGILLYHDLMFVDQAGHRPVQTQNVEAEIRHAVRSLAAHPSMATWNACNECVTTMGTPTEIYATFVMQTVAEEDDTRSIWPGSPSPFGWKTGVRTIDGRPNGKPLVTWGPDEPRKELESHGPYMRSLSKDHPGVNGVDHGSTLSPEYWGIHGNAPPDTCTAQGEGYENSCVGDNVLAERNYPCDNHIKAYFGNLTDLNAVGEASFQEQMFHCMVAQTLWMKGDIEKRRSSNTYGLLIWQMNENWPTGGWGCIEYGPEGSDKSQVVGGRWKPLMHLLESSLYRDVMAACGLDNLCYIRNDGQNPLGATVSFEAWDLEQSTNEMLNYPIILPAGTIYRFALPSDFAVGKSAVLVSVFDQALANPIVENTFLWQYPKDMAGLRNYVKVRIQSITAVNGSIAEVTVHSDRLALFVLLTSRAQGRFSENAFALRPMKPKTILFSSMITGEPIDLEKLRNTIRVEHLGYYIGAVDGHEEGGTEVIK